MPALIPDAPFDSVRERISLGTARRISRLCRGFWARRLKNPVFLLGFNNSGKSTIAAVLGSHTELSIYPGEGNGELWFKGFFPWIRSDQSVGPIWSEPDRFVSEVLKARRDAFLAARAHLGAYSWITGAKRLLNDSGMIAALAPDLLVQFPDAKFLHFLRHGCVSSYITARIEWSAMMRSPAKYLTHGIPLDFKSVLASMGRYWAWTVQRVDRVAQAFPGQLLEIRYEEWCRDPAHVILRVSEFLGLEAGVATRLSLAPLEDLTPFVVDDISDPEWEVLDHALGPTLAVKGYGNRTGLEDW